ncbi:F0F1 ATP synthase subunit B' [Fuscibacter oryzae]|uniref:ATP synthase subunit b n=1 Tax=Fuscibacter oryzae TaxID=2803939 RepID=A0A8J7MNY5_9RHOB|nr:F0F1 ATP synthase subunit B' [Fuscibacter oryzae]MBL4926983.1 F0F1 ATP synthase subunit B' [Fuscibacter oryzae]
MATEAHEAAPAWHATGMPQLDITTWANQIFWLAVALVVIFLVLWRVALPRIGAVLAERRGTITNDLAAAEELKQKALAAEKAYNDALAAARAEAGRIVAKAKADIQGDLNAAIAKADAEIAAKTAESEKALAEIRAGAEQAVSAVALDTADAVVSALGGQADPAAVKAAVAAALKG